MGLSLMTGLFGLQVQWAAIQKMAAAIEEQHDVEEAFRRNWSINLKEQKYEE